MQTLHWHWVHRLVLLALKQAVCYPLWVLACHDSREGLRGCAWISAERVKPLTETGDAGRFTNLCFFRRIVSSSTHLSSFPCHTSEEYVSLSPVPSGSSCLAFKIESNYSESPRSCLECHQTIIGLPVGSPSACLHGSHIVMTMILGFVLELLPWDPFVTPSAD